MIKKCPGIKSLIFYISKLGRARRLRRVDNGLNDQRQASHSCTVQWSERATEVM
jgi:hypothetical protein